MEVEMPNPSFFNGILFLPGSKVSKYMKAMESSIPGSASEMVLIMGILYSIFYNVSEDYSIP
ncbi:hypothetical protein [Rossellomorea aquimaris]|uniref:hypothetical protein n=1 Tax=Rossellomorea aquimaris TaxID=189382 RepID=UPI00125A4ABD|nr:hypothetical protein [Rossellomorea aquimaris]TYS90123.1 hypothetical protein FZC88_11175 [Rossellomorea aquimaris]